MGFGSLETGLTVGVAGQIRHEREEEGRYDFRMVESRQKGLAQEYWQRSEL